MVLVLVLDCWSTWDQDQDHRGSRFLFLPATSCLCCSSPASPNIRRTSGDVSHRDGLTAVIRLIPLIAPSGSSCMAEKIFPSCS
ncbi:hypothetical protein EYF80_034763 [Liparis tanakae]|uniref:Uncharacterized protein n=1 Tax=Liparis tanakae TaxID=230148 RepID=A0A4Z2GNC3_9TELE|nr:hypothetical protein EYF80_034763 [Liparis tanakae]